ncbi:hypothetical protein B1R32_101263 [Abditibacterium utsteinense]|uniref:Uncharacterized protein n=1 Tax=Abditibacterium utsteinense TaxID=1960156 RepID=A0A2S8SXI9_9BACT|nr:hypothetical protein [Abditibacterium utsteinense]PQV65521.1 hypothetical protein B1R32_101263 [Abditibacterium utsteinense]
MRFIFCGKFLLLGFLLALPRISRADNFAAKNDAALALNAPGLVFKLSLPQGKTRFQIGEVIPVTLNFSNLGAQPLQLVRFVQGEHNFAQFEVDPREGVTDPLGEIPPPTYIASTGPPPPARLALDANSHIETVSINETLRFDRPGIYRLYAHTWRVFPGAPLKKKSPFSLPPSTPRTESTSNVIQFEIVPTDLNWAHAEVQAQRALWKQPQRWFEDRLEAPSFRYLQTPEAMDAIIERLGTGESPRSSEDETYRWQLSLVGYTNRPALINAMRRAIARPDYTVSQGLLDTLTLLRALEIQKKPNAARLELQKAALKTKSKGLQSLMEGPLYPLQSQLLIEDWQRAKIALSHKTGRARAMTVHSLLELAWHNPTLAKKVGAARIEDLQVQVPSIFSDLPELPQQYLLGKTEWPRIQSPAMKAPLIALWNNLPPRDGYYADFADSVLERILEVAPAQGRALALREMVALPPRVSNRALLKLPGGDLPQFDQIWLHFLTTNGNAQEDAALLIGRFGSPAIKREVQRIYEERRRDKMLSSDVSQGLQTYLKRAARSHSQ